MFYDIFETLCKQKGVSCKKAVIEMGLSHSIAAKWKKTGATPNGTTLTKVSKYFGVPVSALIGVQEPRDPLIVWDDEEIYDQVKAWQENQPAALDGELSEVKKKVLDRLNHMTDEEIKKVIALLDVLDAEFK